jgi:hypothetical protein
MLYIIDELMHDWYTSSTLVEAPTSRLISTCFMVDLAYIHFILLWCMVDVLAWCK